MTLVKLDNHTQKNEPLLISSAHIKEKWTKNLGLRAETIKLLDENIKENIKGKFLDLVLVIIFQIWHQKQK